MWAGLELRLPARLAGTHLFLSGSVGSGQQNIHPQSQHDKAGTPGPLCTHQHHSRARGSSVGKVIFHSYFTAQYSALRIVELLSKWDIKQYRESCVNILKYLLLKWLLCAIFYDLNHIKMQISFHWSDVLLYVN